MYAHAFQWFFPPSVLDIEPESEDEDAIVERRRQLRQAIVQKYQQLLNPSSTEPPSLAVSPTPSADSDDVGNVAAKDLEESIQQAELKIKQKVAEEGEGGKGSVGPSKAEGRQREEEEAKQQKSNLLAVREAVRNGDMFEDMFSEKYLVG